MTPTMREALEWALGEIDVLSNRLTGWAYPQGMPLLGREGQFEKYRDARAALSTKQEVEECLSGRGLSSDEHSTWVLVPREPTEAMYVASARALKVYLDSLPPDKRGNMRKRKGRDGQWHGYQVKPQIKTVIRWQAMIDAAPPAPPQEGLVAGAEPGRSAVIRASEPPSSTGGRTETLPIDRETLGRMVREAWVRWALTQQNPKPSWLAPYDALSEPDKEADRQIGEAICKWTVIHYEARHALLSSDTGGRTEEVREALENLCDAIADTEMHGDGAHDEDCSVCKAHQAARALLSLGEDGGAK